MCIICDVFKKQYEFVALNVDVSDLVYHSDLKGTSTLCEYGCTVTTSITSIFFCAGCPMENVNIFYLRYEIAGDQFCVQKVSGINPVIYEFTVTCCYFETTDETSSQFETYIQ